MALIQKVKLNILAKDLDLKNKDIIDFLAEKDVTIKNHMATLETDELNMVFEHFTKSNQVDNIDKFMYSEKKAQPAPAPVQDTAAAAVAADSPKTEQGASGGQAEVAPAQPPRMDTPATKQDSRPVQPAPQRSQQPRPAGQQSQPRPAGQQGQQGQPRPAGQQGQQGQPRPAGQQGQQGQPRPAGQQGQQGQPRPAGQQGQQGQPRPAGQQGQQGQYRPAGQQRQQQQSRPFGQQGQQSRPAGQQPPATAAQQAQRAERNARFEKPRWDERQKTAPKNAQPQRPAAPTDRITVSGGGQGRANESGVRFQDAKTVDTRTSTVDLGKFDERFGKLVPDAVKDMSADKQKLRGGDVRRKQQNDKERLSFDKLRREQIEKAKKKQLEITLPDEIIVSDLAAKLRVTTGEVVKKLMGLGVMANVNQPIEYDIAAIVAEEMGAKVTREVIVTIEDKLFDESEDNAEQLQSRSPVVVVMGHVDHGKTSLLDAIRSTNVVAGEAGGITQHIGAYRVRVNDRDITFLDTPGHAAFTAMRARGAQVTDIAILVVAADDGIMPQTIEAINHAKAAGVSLIVAINKMDKPSANPEAIKQELTKYELIPEEWGGDTICIPVSAVTRKGIDELLEMVILTADMKELKANPDRLAKGVVIEAKLDKGRGAVATVLVQNGTLNSGDVVIAGKSVGRIRIMTDDKGETVKKAGPSIPVEIVGLAEVPDAGDIFYAVEDERMARELVEQRKSNAKEEHFNANAKVSLDDLFAQISLGTKELSIIIKADVQGSVEALRSSLEKIQNEEVKVRVLHGGVGGINETDVMLASASNAIIVGFNVRPDKQAIDSAERQKVDVRTYRIIYECIEEITAAMKGMLTPKFKEAVLGHAQVRQTIKVPNVGIIAGSYVQDGKITRAAQIRIVRDGIVIAEDKIDSLRRFKDDVREVAQGYECGIGLDKFNDIKENDILEAFIMEEIAR